MDVPDSAEAEIQNYVTSAVANARRNNTTKLIADGICHYCFEDVGKDQLFCDSNCAKDFELLEQRQR